MCTQNLSKANNDDICFQGEFVIWAGLTGDSLSPFHLVSVVTAQTLEPSEGAFAHMFSN